MPIDPEKPYSTSQANDDARKDPPLVQLLSTLFGAPRVVFDNGVEQGREWSSSWSYGSPCRHSKQRKSTCEKVDDPNIDSSKDWYDWVRSELERGEQIASQMYESWDKERPPEKDGRPKAGQTDPVDELLASLGSLAIQMRNEFATDFERARAEFQRQIASQLEKPEEVFGSPEFHRSSPYSPLQLEREHGFDRSWRVRFEDLLRAENERQLTCKEESAAYQRQAQPAWLQDFYIRLMGFNVFDPAYGRHCPVSPSYQKHEHEPEASELDAYEQLLLDSPRNQLAARIEKHKQELQRNSSPKPGFAEDKATFTSKYVRSFTEKDGSTVTKYVERKKLADGRREKTETTFRDGKVEKSETTTTPASSWGGWFWSK